MTSVVGIFFRRQHPKSAEAARRIMEADYGSDVRFVADEANKAGHAARSEKEGLRFAISIGGDGTFLRTAQAVIGLKIPLFGVNTGKLGFLTSGTPETAVDDVRKILAGEYRVDDHPVLKGEVIRDGSVSRSTYGINEIAIIKDSPSRPIDLDIHANGEPLYRILSDGVIVATPTGSTAYALSTGGPIVHPSVRCLLVVPICPHSLYQRPIVFGEDDVIEARLVSGSGRTTITGDGHKNIALEIGDVVRISRVRDCCFHVIKVDDATYYDVLRSKFSWGSNGERDTSYDAEQ